MLRDEMRRESVADGADGRLPTGLNGGAPSTIAGGKPAECATGTMPQGQPTGAHSTHAGVKPADGAIDSVPLGHLPSAPSTIAGAEPAGEAKPVLPQGHLSGASPFIPAAKRARRAKPLQAPNLEVPDATVAADKAAECANQPTPQGQRERAHSTNAGASRRGKAISALAPDRCAPSPTDAAGDGRGADHLAHTTLRQAVGTEHTRGQSERDTLEVPAAREGGEGQLIGAYQHVAADPALIHIIRSLHREHRGIQRSVGDWTRRIKAEERWFAVARMRAAGEPLPDGKFPKVTDADEAAVIATRARYFAARDFTETQRKACQKELLKAAKQLPVSYTHLTLPTIYSV